MRLSQEASERRAEAAEASVRELKEAAAAAPEAELHHQLKVFQCFC